METRQRWKHANKVGEEYISFFQTLGILDLHKVQHLARLLQSLYELVSKLDGHLGPTGSAIQFAISRLCAAENPLSAPQHKWSRVLDRLGFFSDADDHACRIVNIGLSYVYRHKELNALTTANSHRLRALRDSSASGGDGVRGVEAAKQLGSRGGVVVSRRPVGTKLSRPARGSSSASSAGTGGSKGEQVGGREVGDNDGQRDQQAVAPLDDDYEAALPDGGAVVQRAVSQMETLNVDAGELSVGDGGIVVARRPRLRVASNPPGTSDAPGSASGVATPPKSGTVTPQKLDRCHTTKSGPPIEATKVVGTVQPVILPSDAAIQCITEVLGGIRETTDVRGVLQELVNDSLL